MKQQPQIIRVIPNAQFLMSHKARKKALWGGRGSAKSWSVARCLVWKLTESKQRWLCAREIQNSINESVHKILKDQIEALNLERYWNITDRTLTGVNGSEFIFAGLWNNVKKIKSLEGLDGAWVEEAEAVSQNSWDVLIPTVRKTGSEIWATFNPEKPEDPASQLFIESIKPQAEWKEGGVYYGKDLISARINWQQNPWLPEVLIKEKDLLYKRDFDLAEHVWGGHYKSNSASQIFRHKCFVEEFVPKAQWDGPYFGMDFGFSVDPCCVVRCFIDMEKAILYVDYDANGVGIEIRDLPQLVDSVPESRHYQILADCSRPETISHLSSFGFHIRGAEKWSGSVEDGIAFLRSFDKIVLHPRCTLAQQEARLYSYKVDRLTGQVTRVVVDAYNHFWDALRYALQPLIAQETSFIETDDSNEVQINPELGSIPL